MKDMPSILELCREYHEEAQLTDISYHEEATRVTVWGLIEEPDCMAIVAEEDKVIVGMYGAIAQRYFCSLDRISYEYPLYVKQGYRTGLAAYLMVRHYCEWAKKNGIKMMFGGATSGLKTDRTVMIFEKFGFKRRGPLMSREVI